MNSIKEYGVTALVRHDDQPGPESVMTATVEARNEGCVKRLLLERLWQQSMLLSRWIKIKERRSDDA